MGAVPSRSQVAPLLLVDGFNLLWRGHFGFPAPVYSRDKTRNLTGLFAFFALLRASIRDDLDLGPVEVCVVLDGENDQNLPKRSREGNHIRAALVLGTESQAKMALGETPVDKGAAPHKLRLGFDKGQVVVAGEGLKLAPGQSSMNVRTHYINDDEADEIADRAKALRSGVDTRTAGEPAEDVDHLADIAHVVGSEQRMRTQEVLQRLAERNPRIYREWTFASLTAVLDGTGAEPYKTGGIMHVSRDRIRQALEERESEQANDEID